jgi:hypothetical protein
MGIEMHDKSGQPPSIADVREAKQVVVKHAIVGIAKLPPELAVQMMNILRCLTYLEHLLEREGAKVRAVLDE